MLFRRRRRPPEPQVAALTADQRRWLAERLAESRELVGQCTGRRAELPSAEDLDAVLVARDAGDERCSAQTVVDAVAVAFGEHLARACRLEWVMATDEWGTDLALHGQPGNLLLHPQSSVGSRVTEGETGFIATLLHELIEAVEQSRGRPQG